MWLPPSRPPGWGVNHIEPRIPWDGAPRAPRRWQAEALPKLQEALRARKKPIIQATTGAGKSILISEACWLTLPKAQAQGRAIVVGVPSQSLVRQFAPTIQARCGASNVGMYFADKKDAHKPIVVVCYASLPQLAVDLALIRPKSPEPLLMICDEVHKSECDRVHQGVQALRPRSICGLTATPFRADKGESITLFDHLAYQYTMGQAIRDGVLVRDEWRWDTEGGDVNEQVLRMIRAELYPGGSYIGPGVVSAVSIADAEDFAQTLRMADFPAEAVHSNLTPKEGRRRIEDLQAGKLRAVVHCSMLAEGVDYPWLRWIALRRPVSSPVRFLQEAGRVLRSDPSNPEKTFGLILDPHNIAGELGLLFDPAIGSADSLEEAILREGEPADPNRPKESQPLPPGKAVELATQWTQRIALVLEAEGITQPPSSSRRWRSAPCTTRQVEAIQGTEGRKGLIRMIRYLPEEIRAPIRLLSEQAHTLQSGACSDLINILLGVAECTKQERQWWATKAGERPTPWVWPKDVQVPTLKMEAREQLEDQLSLRTSLVTA